jgi:hypothetical protein
VTISAINHKKRFVISGLPLFELDQDPKQVSEARGGKLFLEVPPYTSVDNLRHKKTEILFLLGGQEEAIHQQRNGREPKIGRDSDAPLSVRTSAMMYGNRFVIFRAKSRRGKGAS